MDKLTLERIQLLHPTLRADATEAYSKVCEAVKGRVMVRMSYTLRTFAEQNALYAQGRTKPGSIVTNAKGGQSYHNYGLAFDIALVLDTDGDGDYDKASWDIKLDYDKDGTPEWTEAVRIFKAHGWEWGGDWTKFKDYPHFQKVGGRSWRELLDLQISGQVDCGYVIL